MQDLKFSVGQNNSKNAIFEQDNIYSVTLNRALMQAHSMNYKSYTCPLDQRLLCGHKTQFQTFVGVFDSGRPDRLATHAEHIRLSIHILLYPLPRN